MELGSAQDEFENDANEDVKTESVKKEAPRPVETHVKTPHQTHQVALRTNDRGVLIAGSLDEQWRLATAFFKSGLMPRALNSPEKVLVGLQLCAELGLPAISSIGKVMVISGSPSLFGELPLALVRRSKLLKAFNESFVKNEKGELVAAVCKATRADTGEECERSFSVEDAKRAGLWAKPGPWSLYPSRMLQLRARGWLIKDQFSDVLFGVSQAEYEHNVLEVNGEVVGDVQAGESIASQLNRTYLEEK